MRGEHGRTAVVARLRIFVRLSERVFGKPSVGIVRETRRSQPRRRTDQFVQERRSTPERLERRRPRSLETRSRRLVRVRQFRVSAAGDGTVVGGRGVRVGGRPADKFSSFSPPLPPQLPRFFDQSIIGPPFGQSVSVVNGL